MNRDLDSQPDYKVPKNITKPKTIKADYVWNKSKGDAKVPMSKGRTYEQAKKEITAILLNDNHFCSDFAKRVVENIANSVKDDQGENIIAPVESLDGFEEIF